MNAAAHMAVLFAVMAGCADAGLPRPSRPTRVTERSSPAPTDSADIAPADDVSAAPPVSSTAQAPDDTAIEVPDKPRCWQLHGVAPGKGPAPPATSNDFEPPPPISALVKPSPFGRCYHDLLGRAPDGGTPPAGRVTLTFVVEPDGRVREACTSRSDIADEPFMVCVTHAILAKRYPRPVGGGRVTVTYPLVFTPGE